MSDTIDIQLTQLVNQTHGLTVRNSRPSIAGVKMPKVRASQLYTTDAWITGKIQTELKLTQPITTDSGDLILRSASGCINMQGSTLVNYITAQANSDVDLIYHTTTPVTNPAANNLRLYADSTGRLAWRIPSGISTIIDSSALTTDRTFTLPNSDTYIIGRDTVDTLTGKSISSATNTITIGGNNINLLIGQDVRTTASPTFVAATLTNQLTINTSGTHSMTINQSGSAITNDVLFQKKWSKCIWRWDK